MFAEVSADARERALAIASPPVSPNPDLSRIIATATKLRLRPVLHVRQQRGIGDGSTGDGGR